MPHGPTTTGGHDPYTIDGHLYFTRRALQSIRAEPVDYVKYSLKKAACLWLGNPAAEATYVDIYDRQARRQWHPYSSLKVLHMVIAWQLLILALVGLIFFAVRGRLRPLLPLVGVCAYFTLVHMITCLRCVTASLCTPCWRLSWRQSAGRVSTLSSRG